MAETPAPDATSTSSNTPYAARRFAFPFYQSRPPSERAATPEGHRRLTDWSKEQLGPAPPPINDGRINLAEIIGTDAITEIDALGEFSFQALGDSGVGHAEEAEEVAEEMASDYRPDAGALNPAFLFHLGDVVYGPMKSEYYGERFYRPYRHYPGKILAIPGNHDGEAKSAADTPSLNAFRANFCAPTAQVPQQASGSGIFRETMILPGVYWCLEAPFVRIIGLYSNLLENPGYLQAKNEAGEIDLSQIDWLTATLKDIASKKDGKALVLATHHPPYSSAGHSGSFEMSDSIDAACDAAGVTPDAVMSGHAHNYQHYSRRKGGKVIPYFVVGTGGIGSQAVPPATGQPVEGRVGVTYDKAISSLGYLYVTAKKGSVTFEFWQKGTDHIDPFDRVEILLG